MKARDLFTTIRTEGGLLPADLLQRIVHADKELPGLDDASYHLVAGERLNERISQSWNRLLGTWKAFRAAANALPETDTGTTLTRERWLLVLLQELGYGRLPAARATEIDGKSYAISHFWHRSPMHLVSYRLDLDRRTAGVAGAARTSPHSLIQELLNRSDDHLWGFVSNGLRLRLLRDNVSLTRQAYVEFDLEGMLDGEVYADFVVLWLVCHQSRVEAEKPEECWLERWARVAQERGTRALDHLRAGVEQAINALGSGCLAHPANAQLKEKLRSGELSGQDYYRQLLRLVYRLLFLLVAEDRALLYDPEATPGARERSIRYSTARLRHLAAGHRGTKHMDLYRGLRIVMEKLGSDEGCSPLALPALGSFLWSETAIPDLAHCDISNRDFLDAVRALAFTLDNKILRSVDYKNLGSEELGSIYESLLELHPEFNIDAATFNLTTAGGHERKTTGSYYTPTSLIQCLLDSALDPVLAEAARQPNAEEAILSLKVCDPACGSGHFLIAAAHRMARRLAAIRTGDEEPSPEATHKALREVISRCIYGVDVNPMAVELCKVSLWMEALEPGKPLAFLEHRIQCGDSLLGTTPALLAQGIPDAAFAPKEGPPEVNPWGTAFKQGLFNMTSDSHLFRTREQLEAEGLDLTDNIFWAGDQTYLPLYEAKMLHHFDHRFGTYLGQTEAQANQSMLPELDDIHHADPNMVALPRYWVPEHEVIEQLHGKWTRAWLLGWRDITNTTNERTVIARCLFRKSGASRTSCPRRRASSPHGARLLDSRFRGNDARPQALAVYV